MIIPLHYTLNWQKEMSDICTSPATVLAAVTKLTNQTNIRTSRMLFSTPTKHKPLKNPVLASDCKPVATRRWR